MNVNIFLALTRIGFGWIFLWAFLDKLLGLGFATCRDGETSVVTSMCEKAWLMGGSPTTGFLNFATAGPFADMFQALAGSTLVDWLFMLGLLGIGISFLLGIMTRLAVWSGVAMMVLMWLAVLPPQNNPILDDHIIYALVMLSFLSIPVGERLGFSKQWAEMTNNSRLLN